MVVLVKPVTVAYDGINIMTEHFKKEIFLTMFSNLDEIPDQ